MQEVARPAPAGTRDVLRLAWPSVLSFVCNSAYRINDQYWIRDLGPDAQAALGASVFLLILNFAFFFVGVSAALALVARATGAGQPRERDAAIRHALALEALVALALCLVGPPLAPHIAGWLGLTGAPAQLASEYLGTIYLYALPLAVAPVVDTVFIGMGNTLVPLLLQAFAVVTNFILNPCLIYGFGPFEARGIAGAALATSISRMVAVVVGLTVMRYSFRVRWGKPLEFELKRIREMLRIGIPSAVSIAVYAAVYFALIRQVITPLGRDVLAALGIGFNAFEAPSFPFYLGIAVAGSSLVGRNLGAGARENALTAVRSTRRVGGAAGLTFALAFFFLAPLGVPFFTQDPGVQVEAVLYLRVIAVSQLFVAFEAVNEKVLLGAGTTQPIFWISVPGNILRVPLAWFLALQLGAGGPGVWWAINASTILKAAAFHWMVERKRWLGELRTQ